MIFNTDIKIEKSSFNPLELYDVYADSFMDGYMSDAILDDLHREYDNLPKKATLDQITNMYNKSVGLSPSGLLHVDRIKMTPYHLAIFYESEEDDEFVLDIDIMRESYSVELYQ